MKKVLLFLLFLLISSCSKQELILDEKNILDDVNVVDEKYFAVIPHHNLVNSEIDNFYRNLQNKYNDFDNIVIVSPNHFTNENFLIKNEWKYCYKLDNNDCLKINALNINLDTIENISSIEEKKWYFEIKDHGIANHFKFINKYFINSNKYAILLKINTKKDDFLVSLEEKLNNYKFTWKTLFIASIDSSHHVNEKIAVFHDINTINYLNNWYVRNIEVDCPNCLYLIKDLADLNKKNYFNLYNRTSVDKKLLINSNYENTSHIYWEFNSFIYSDNLDRSFSWSYFKSLYEKPFLKNKNKNEITGMFFWDTQFTRWFINQDISNKIENYLQCFYSNKDLKRENIFWHNRFFYSLNFVWVNLETSIWEKNECEKSSKENIFQTRPKYLDSFKDIWINIYNLANNHIYDCWNIWYDATKKYLTERNLLYFWGWIKQEESILKNEIYWTKIAFVWFNDIWNQINIESKSEIIKELTKQWYIVVVNIHWWWEYDLKSNNRQQKIAKSFIDSGAKLIIWHHPHVPQEYEVYKGVPIFYSLWNFIFDQSFKNTLSWYWVVFAINWEWIKYNIVKFMRKSNNYEIDCNSFK